MFLNFKKIKLSPGFTLIELLIVIAILSILATVTLLVINPAQMIKQSRDATRLSDITTIVKALRVYSGSGANESTMGSTNTIYVSVPAVSSDCSDLNLPAPLSGWSYACSTSANYRKADGTGWIPVDFTSITYGSPLTSLSIDPTNATSTGLYYTYIKGSIAVSAGMESEKYLTSTATTDGGYSPYRYEAGNDLVQNTYIPNCGGTAVSWQGKTYNTVQIGKQCWFQTNLDYDNGCSSKVWANNTDVGWCGYYTGGPFTNEGLLYQWSAAMNGSTSAGAQGLCPTGWHIPTDAEWIIMEESLGMCSGAGAGCSGATGSWRGTNEGGKLKETGTTHWTSVTCGGTCNTSGFTALGTGLRHTSDGLFYWRLTTMYFWSSDSYSIDQWGGLAWKRYLAPNMATVYRGTTNKAYGVPIRCLKN
ncbi:MAG: FISUMP domain-containing protein [bacterium]|nr:FISUMP domain-containing protein [bacterium]